MSSWWDRKLGNPQTSQPSQHSSQSGPFVSPGRNEAFKNLDEALKAGYAGKGGEAARRERNHCPNCGSGNVFTRTNQAFAGVDSGAGTVMNQQGQSVVVSARCFECNWNSAGYDLSAW